MKNINDDEVILWLLEGDVSIQYQVYRDLLNTERDDLRDRIAREGWGARFLSHRNKTGHWGEAFYQPKWISSHYTLLDLKNLSIKPDLKEINETLTLIVENNRCADGGINPPGSVKYSDVCINGMFLNYASYFKINKNEINPVVDFLIAQQMEDGGFNCRSNRTFSICKVGDCELQIYQTVTILKRATTLEFTTISPILYIHCYQPYFIQNQSHHLFLSFLKLYLMKLVVLHSS
ncbi:MAG: hypothetical protein K8H86_12945 [Ignavibacteriaceae bacterium]|nr:hypothetical protein [Ignavibacteriaceae bacterium]